MLQKKADETTDDNVKAAYNKEIAESRSIRKKMFNDEVYVTPRNKEVEVKDLSPVEVIQREAGKNQLGAYSEIVNQNPEVAHDVLLDYAMQKHGVSQDGEVLEGGGRELPNQEVDKAVSKAFPDQKSVIDFINDRNDSKEVADLSKEVGVKIEPILKRINDADYINEKELDDAADHLYNLMDAVDRSDMSKSKKESSLNLIEPIIHKIEGYEFRTKTETGETTEEKATLVPRKIVEPTERTAKSLSNWGRSRVEFTSEDGAKTEGILTEKDGNYYIENENGDKVKVIGEKAISDRDITLAPKEVVPQPIQFDENGDVESITLQLNKVDMEKGGKVPAGLITIKPKNKEKALDFAIQLRAEEIGEVPQPEFDTIYEEVKKPYTKEVLVSDGKPAIEGKAAETKSDSGIKIGDEVQWESQGADQFESPKKVTAISEDGKFAFVERSNTGIPIEQLKKPTNETTPRSTSNTESVTTKEGVKSKETSSEGGEGAAKIFDAIEAADRSKVRKKDKEAAAQEAAASFGEQGEKAFDIHRNFDNIVKALKENNKLEVKC